MQLNNVHAFVLTVPDETLCKPASLMIAARGFGCCLFVLYIVWVYLRCVPVG